MDKWTVIGIIAFIVGMFSPVLVTESNRGHCKTEAIRAGMPADDIIKLCGK
jgi:hypothetical protein